jgi:CBS domain-containing protein
MSISQVMRKDVVTINLSSNLRDAINLMQMNHIGTVIVLGKMNGGAKVPVGILTDRDIAIALKERVELTTATPVEDIMQRNVIMCKEDEGIYQVIHKLKENGIRRMPVVDHKDHLVGIATADDLNKLLAMEITELSEIIDHEVSKEGHRFGTKTSYSSSHLQASSLSSSSKDLGAQYGPIL